jgi:hypothetical protein
MRKSENMFCLRITAATVHTTRLQNVCGVTKKASSRNVTGLAQISFRIDI